MSLSSKNNTIVRVRRPGFLVKQTDMAVPPCAASTKAWLVCPTHTQAEACWGFTGMETAGTLHKWGGDRVLESWLLYSSPSLKTKVTATLPQPIYYKERSLSGKDLDTVSSTLLTAQLAMITYHCLTHTCTCTWQSWLILSAPRNVDLRDWLLKKRIIRFTSELGPAIKPYKNHLISWLVYITETISFVVPHLQKEERATWRCRKMDDKTDIVTWSYALC